MMIAPNSRAPLGREVKGGGEGGIWKNLSGGGGESELRGNDTTQSATCCTKSKRG